MRKRILALTCTFVILFNSSLFVKKAYSSIVVAEILRRVAIVSVPWIARGILKTTQVGQDVSEWLDKQLDTAKGDSLEKAWNRSFAKKIYDQIRAKFSDDEISSIQENGLTSDDLARLDLAKLKNDLISNVLNIDTADNNKALIAWQHALDKAYSGDNFTITWESGFINGKIDSIDNFSTSHVDKENEGSGFNAKKINYSIDNYYHSNDWFILLDYADNLYVARGDYNPSCFNWDYKKFTNIKDTAALSDILHTVDWAYLNTVAAWNFSGSGTSTVSNRRVSPNFTNKEILDAINKSSSITYPGNIPYSDDYTKNRENARDYVYTPDNSISLEIEKQGDIVKESNGILSKIWELIKGIVDFFVNFFSNLLNFILDLFIPKLGIRDILVALKSKFFLPDLQLQTSFSKQPFRYTLRFDTGLVIPIDFSGELFIKVRDLLNALVILFFSVSIFKKVANIWGGGE